MSEVAGICSAPIVAEIRSRGLDVDFLVEGLGVDIHSLENQHGRVPWRDFVPFAARAAKMLGKDVLEDLAANATVAAVPSSFRRLLPRVTDSRTLFLLAPRWWGPRIFSGTHGVCEALPDGRLREVVRIAPEYEPSPEFLDGLKGTLRAIPRLTNQPDALVDLQQDGREGQFLISPPPALDSRRRGPLGRWLRLGTAQRDARKLTEAVRELEEFGFAQEEVLAQHRELNLATTRLDREQRQRESLEALAEILERADASDLEALQRELVAFFVARDEVAGARIMLHASDGSRERVVAGGHLAGLPDRDVPLRIGPREVGRLSLWAVLEGDDLESLERLESWTAFALENGSAKALNRHLKQMLSQDLFDWQRMEQRLEDLSARLPSVPPAGR